MAPPGGEEAPAGSGGAGTDAVTVTNGRPGPDGAGYGLSPGQEPPTAPTPPRRRHDPALDGEGASMTIFEHLDEMRRRILIATAAVVVTTIIGWFLYNPLLHFMVHSYAGFCNHHTGRCLINKLVVLNPVEGFTTRLKLSSYIGIALAAPVWLWQVWRFITPGLRRNEKKYALPFVCSALVLFSMGVGMAILVWPKAIAWLTSVAGPNVASVYSVGDYVSVYMLVCLIFGVVFLYPIVVVFLMISGVVPTAKWRKWRRPAIVVLCAVAAIVTPSNDPFTFLGMWVPMVIFYELSILLGRILRK